MPILHVVVMLITWTLVMIFVFGVKLLYALCLLGITLLVIIAVYRAAWPRR